MAPVDPRSRSREAQSNSGPSRDASAGSVERERHLGSLIPEDSEDASVSQRSRAERYREAAKFIDGHGAARVCPPSQDGDRLPVQGGKVDAGSSDFRYTITAGAPEGRAPDIEIRFSWQGQTSRGVLFELEVENANLVQIAGEFNDWKPETMARDRTSPRLWRVIKPLPRGEYRYKFVINGRWMNDPLNPKQKPNPFGGTDSILRIADAP